MKVCKITWFCSWKKGKECTAKIKCVFKKESGDGQSKKNTKGI